MVEDRQLIGKGGVKAEVRLVLEGGYVAQLAPSDVCPHAHGLQRIGAAELVVAHHAPHQAEPGALEDHPALELHIAAGGDIELEGLRVHVGDHGIERMDTLEYDHLVLFQLDGLGRLLDTHAAGELVLGHIDALAPRKLLKVPVQEIHVQTQRRFQIQIPLRRAGRAAVYGFEIVVHAYVVGVHTALLQRFGDLHGSRGLARAGGAGQQNDGAALFVFQNAVHRLAHSVTVELVAFSHKALGIAHGF